VPSGCKLKLSVLCPEVWQAHDQDPTPYFQNWNASVCWIAKANASEQVRALAQSNFDAYINLCDGSVDDDEAGIEVVRALEQLDLTFTGARSDFYDPSREEMKRACERVGVPTPQFLFVTREQHIADAINQLRLPMIVKHPNGHSSIGLFKESLVENAEQLDTQVRRMLADYGGALIEEFIAGREFDVLVVENAGDPADPFAYAPAEFLFPPGETFKHYNLKWIDYDGMQCVPCQDPVLAARLQTVSKKLFVALNGSGYGRCDLRMDARGELYLLEINPNCGIFYPPDELGSADFILMQHPDGHDGFIERIIRAALSRQ
jgi:D-alanine-D-alanine ligase-like ATP-grasp enzyme